MLFLGYWEIAQIIGRVESVHFTREDFYQIEIDTPEPANHALNSSPIELLGARSICYAWEPGCDPTQAMQNGGGLFPLTISLLNLRQEYVPMLSTIIGKFGLVLKKNRNSIQEDFGSLSIWTSHQGFVANTRWNKKLNTLGNGLPKRCFYCGHIEYKLKDYLERISKQENDMEKMHMIGEQATTQWTLGHEKRTISLI